MVISVKIKTLFKNIAIPLAVGLIAGFLTRNDVKEFMVTAQKPSFMPPGWLFPIAWTVLYILMGISAYLVEASPKGRSTRGLILYYAQLFFNFCWSFIFFSFNLYLFALIWIIILLALIILTAISFYKTEPKSAFLLIPYIIWVSFATILNYSIFTLNP